MEFSSSPLDQQKRNEFHTKAFIQDQIKVKNDAHADLIKALDELAEVSDQNTERINKLNEIISHGVSAEFVKLYQEAITKYENLSVLALHFYTMLFEHISTVNSYLNIIIKILKQGIGDVYDVETVDQAKKDFSSFIENNSKFAKQIRVNVDAHFDGDYKEHLGLIRSLSYSDFIALYIEYISKMDAFLKALKPAIERLRLTADASYHTLVAFSVHKSK